MMIPRNCHWKWNVFMCAPEHNNIFYLNCITQVRNMNTTQNQKWNLLNWLQMSNGSVKQYRRFATRTFQTAMHSHRTFYSSISFFFFFYGTIYDSNASPFECRLWKQHMVWMCYLTFLMSSTKDHIWFEYLCR